MLEESDEMRMLVMVLAATALLIPNMANAAKVRDPGAGFVGQKNPKLGKNFYVVRKGEGCAIRTGKWGNEPEGMLGGAPYASKAYAKAALKTFPACKGGLVDDETDGKSKRDKD